MATRPAAHRFSVEEYHRMAEAGIFAEDDRVELIDGEVVEMTPIGSQHAAAVSRLNALLQAHAPGRFVVGVQNPVVLDDLSEPEPDLALLRYREDYYAAAHPTPADVLLLVEVCETTCGDDRAVKAPLYSRAGVAELWIVDLVAEIVEVYHEPSAQGYRQRRVAGPAQRIAPRALPDVSVGVAEVLGRVSR